jgi:hypothetical protein
METLINNFVNGNNTIAKKQAKRFAAWRIREALMESAGWTANRAALAADWLKGRDCWQAYCDAN